MADRPRHPTFEEVYPQIEFAPLVELAVDLAEWIKRRVAWSNRGPDGADKADLSAAEIQ